MVEYECLPEDFFLRFFPRNLSYSEESYLDNFSTCSSYVNKPKNPRVFEYFQTRLEPEADWLQIMCDSENPTDQRRRNVDNDGGEGTSVDPVVKPKCDEEVSEEGIFVNMMDDLESVESQDSRASAGSDPSYFSLDSVASPDEAEEITSCDQKCLSDALSKELEKSLSLRQTSSDGEIQPPEESVKSEVLASEMKKAVSEESVLPAKLAQLKIERQGVTLDSGVQRYLLHVPDSPVYEEPEFNINKAELRKSSSLKTNKTPPGTPSRKKMVRFADAMGLDLESIRHVIDAENPPKIPASAISDLKVGVEEARPDVGSRYLDLCFSQPCVATDFMGKVMAKKVSLENCVINDMSITGVVRVANVGYHKCVRVRYSINNWVTFYDVMASYIQNSCDGATDRFSFTIVAPSNVGPGSKISFAVSYTVNDTVYWDSNYGNNYEILCYAKTTPTDLEASWVHFV
ncbi:glycogen-binding subunit 76A-like [Ruditapes philippinarum]|jgi:protein phosphatase 1 regulatory subunit 3A/B/C/D/E|uniref:glycogen-binding subunit 76A-like n=1 Tax=Ruditapes philippinarum TaxID=129788 RepID=UPI00295C22BE|nr:glycogen-binding subunit 76A-like [Ruditapes philippinarum]